METVKEITTPFMNHRSSAKGFKAQPDKGFRETHAAPCCSILGLHRPLVAALEGLGRTGAQFP